MKIERDFILSPNSVVVALRILKHNTQLVCGHQSLIFDDALTNHNHLLITFHQRTRLTQSAKEIFTANKFNSSPLSSPLCSFRLRVASICSVVLSLSIYLTASGSITGCTRMNGMVIELNIYTSDQSQSHTKSRAVVVANHPRQSLR